jgi:hypothetical protein
LAADGEAAGLAAGADAPGAVEAPGDEPGPVQAAIARSAVTSAATRSGAERRRRFIAAWYVGTASPDLGRLAMMAGWIAMTTS